MVLLHGQGGHVENFRHNISAYSADHRVIALDSLWHGLSSRPEGEESDVIGAMAAHVEHLLGHLGIDRAIIEGQSMGGWVAGRIASTRPELVEALILTTPMGLNPKGTAIDVERLGTVRRHQLTALDSLTPEATRRRMEGLFLDPTMLDAEIVELRTKLYANPDLNRSLRWVAERYFDPDYVRDAQLGAAELGAIVAPTLVYWGKANYTPVSVGRAITAAIPGAEWHCAETGHWAQYERWSEHNDVVLEFVYRAQRAKV
jgi:pimeloyl-ACP methyl ester carboxylesterase